MKNTNVEVEGGEIILQSDEGHYAIIPAKDRQKVMDMQGNDAAINEYIKSLPKESDYAEDGTLIKGTDDKKPWEKPLPTSANINSENRSITTPPEFFKTGALDETSYNKNPRMPTKEEEKALTREEMANYMYQQDSRKAGTAEYVPVGVLALPGTPAIRGLGKVGNFIIDAVNPIAGMGKTPGSAINKVASSADDVVDLWRIQEKGARPMSELAAEGKLGKHFQNEKAIKHFKDREEHFGQWFTKDKKDFDFYKADREFTNPEILNLKVPKSELEKYTNFNKSLSRAPEREFVVPLEDQKRFLQTSSVDDVGRGFKSEIDWSKWNKEIPDNKVLMQEYNAIEQQAKANGTWMKNPDGSAFQGTPEQFVQQNSSNFKKAFPNILKEENKVIPLIHHSRSKFDTFDESYNLSGTGANIHGKGVYTIPENSFNKNVTTDVKEFLDGVEGTNPKTLITYGDNKYSLYANDKGLTRHPFKHADPSTNLNKLENVFTVVSPYSNSLKSAIGNNGMFDMTNPNIYKALVPTAIGTGVGIGAASQTNNNITEE